MIHELLMTLFVVQYLKMPKMKNVTLIGVSSYCPCSSFLRNLGQCHMRAAVTSATVPWSPTANCGDSVTAVTIHDSTQGTFIYSVNFTYQHVQHGRNEMLACCECDKPSHGRRTWSENCEGAHVLQW